MPWTDYEHLLQRLWLLQMEVSNLAGRLTAVERRIDRGEDRHDQEVRDEQERDRERISWVQILTAVAPFLYGGILLGAVILGKLTLSEAGSMLLSK